MGKILKIYTIENKNEEEFLRKSSKDITLEQLHSEEFQAFLDNLLFTVQSVETDEGYIAAGLAAVQVGKHYNVFCILKSDDREYEMFVNSKMEILSTIQGLEKEACFSIPKREEKVPRFRKIRLTYLNREGEKQKKVFTDYEAREIQHEYDHTQGILFTDRI